MDELPFDLKLLVDPRLLVLPFRKSGWDDEARRIIIGHNRSVSQAIESVSLRYLYHGCCRPLIDAVQHNHVHTPRVLAYLAAMFDREFRATSRDPVQYELKVGYRRKGAPKRESVPDSLTRTEMERLWDQLDSRNRLIGQLTAGLRKVLKGENPTWQFWRSLAAALYDPDYPITVAIKRMAGHAGRHVDPEVLFRDAILSEAVTECRYQGKNYKQAVAEVAASFGKPITEVNVKNAFRKGAAGAIREIDDFYSKFSLIPATEGP